MMCEKLQIPNSKLQRSSKLQVPTRLSWNLEFGVWSFPGPTSPAEYCVCLLIGQHPE